MPARLSYDRWCERNRNRCYIQEWLLDVWGIPVDSIFSG